MAQNAPDLAAASSAAVVLVVEDESLIRIVVSEALRDEGFRVIEAGNAQDALAVLDAGLHVDVLFTDVRMPGSMDGLALAHRVREERPGIRIVITSGHLVEDPSPEHLPILRKPYLMAEAVNRVRQALTME